MAFWLLVGHVENLEIIATMFIRRRIKRKGGRERDKEKKEEGTKQAIFFPWRIEFIRKTGDRKIQRAPDY